MKIDLTSYKPGTVASLVVSDCSQRKKSSFVIVHVLLCRFVSVIVFCIY